MLEYNNMMSNEYVSDEGLLKSTAIMHLHEV